MTGGKLIGQGTYGCVFSPPLLCKKKKIPQSKVGKLTSEDDIKAETKAYDALSNIKDSQ